MKRRVNGIERSGLDGRDSSNSGSKRNSSSGIYSQLRSRLESMGFQAFRTLVFLWLSAKGYRNVHVLTRSGSRGRRSHGGADFLARSPYHPRSCVAVQIRYWKTPLQGRVVDELRGYMLRKGIREGLIVTNGSVYPAARRSARNLETKPVGLFSSAQFVGSMASLGLGVEKIGGRHEVADWFFRGLDQVRLGHSSSSGRLSAERSANKSTSSSLGTLAGPQFGENWPDSIWWFVIFCLAIVSMVVVLGGGR